MILEILYQDEFIVAINKPNGLMVHRSKISNGVNQFAVQTLRDQIGQRVNPVHRLDKKTSGVLLFALDSESNGFLQKQFMNHEIKKTYKAIVRGYTPELLTIDYDLTNLQNKTQTAVTHFKTIKQFEIDVPLGKHTTSRYSLIELSPTTGRYHQIRKHMAHIFHPIIGDRPHGCNKQNKLWKEKWEIMTMQLHASELTFTHPHTHKTVTVKANLPKDFCYILDNIFT